MARPRNSNETKAQARQMSIVRVAELLNRDRATISRFIKSGCPVAVPARSKGEPVLLDLAEVVEWLLDQRADEVSQKFRSSGEGEDGVGMTEDEAKRRKAVAIAYMAEIELDERRREVVRVSDVVTAVGKALARVRARLMSIPATVAPHLVNVADAAQAATRVRKEIDTALAEMAEVENGDFEPDE